MSRDRTNYEAEYRLELWLEPLEGRHMLDGTMGVVGVIDALPEVELGSESQPPPHDNLLATKITLR